MAMTFEFNIRPFGYQNDAIQFGKMRVHSVGSKHEYAVDYKTKDGWKTIRGAIPKVQHDGTMRSGHRNFLHLMADILDDMNLDDMEPDYVNISAEIATAYPKYEGKVSDYNDEA